MDVNGDNAHPLFAKLKKEARARPRLPGLALLLRSRRRAAAGRAAR